MKYERHGRALARSLTILLNSPYHVIRRPYPHPSLFTAPDPVMPQPALPTSKGLPPSKGLPTYKEGHMVLKAKRVPWQLIGGKRYTPYSKTRPNHPPTRRHSTDDIVVPKNFSPEPIVYGCHFQGVNHSSRFRSCVPVSRTEDQIQAEPLNVSSFQVEAQKFIQSNPTCKTKFSKRSTSVHHYGSQVDEQTCRMLKSLLLGEETMPFCLAWKVLCQIDTSDLYVKKKPAIRYKNIFPPTLVLPPFEEAWKIISQMTYNDVHKSQMAKRLTVTVPIEPASDIPSDSPSKTNHNDALPIESEASKALVPGTLDSPTPKLRGFYHSGPRQTNSNDNLQFGSQALPTTIKGSQGSHHRVCHRRRSQDPFPPLHAQFKHDIPSCEPRYFDNNFWRTGTLLPSQIEQYFNFDMPTPPPPPKIMLTFPGDELNIILASFEQLRRVLTPLLCLMFSCIYGLLSFVGSALADNIKFRISQVPPDSLLHLAICQIFVLWQIWEDTRRQTPLQLAFELYSKLHLYLIQLAFGLYLKLYSYLIPKKRKKNVLSEIC